MAQLEPALKKSLRHALVSTPAPWVVCGLDAEQSPVDGVVGLIDWMLHGQVSRLVKSGALGAGKACVLPGDPLCKRPSFLLAPSGVTAAALLEKLRKLGVTEIALAETTFPADFRSKVKQTLKKEGIRCTTLEPEPDEPR
jgi:hypothetical protein